MTSEIQYSKIHFPKHTKVENMAELNVKIKQLPNIVEFHLNTQFKIQNYNDL